MTTVAPERFAEILDKANRLSYKELGPIYIMAALMAEAGATPEEIVVYLEEKHIDRGEVYEHRNQN